MHDLKTSKYGFDLSVFVALFNSFFRSVESMSVLSCLLDKDIMLFLPDDPYGRLVIYKEKEWYSKLGKIVALM